MNIEVDLNSGRSLPLLQEKLTNQIKPSFENENEISENQQIPLSPEEREVISWRKKRYGFLKGSQFAKAKWFSPDFFPSYEEAREAMYYEKKCRKERKLSNPYRGVSVLKYSALTPEEGKPEDLVPVFENRDPEFNKFVDSIVGSATHKNDLGHEGMVSQVCSIEDLPLRQTKELKKTIEIELQFRNKALGVDLIELEDASDVPAIAIINEMNAEIEKQTAAGVEDWTDGWEPEIQNLVQNDAKDIQNENDDDDAYDSEMEILMGDSEYLPDDLGWEPYEEDPEITQKAAGQEQESKDDSANLIQIFSLTLEYEDEEEFKPNPVQKQKIRESFFGGFDSSDQEEDFQDELETFPRERRMRNRGHLDHHKRRGDAVFRDKHNQPEDDDIYLRLHEQHNNSDE